MELYQLQYFIEVARNRNFTRAGKRLNLATPALSLQIQKLEKELGTRLFNRGQKETLMTPAGETLFEKAQALLTMADSVKQSVAEVSELRAGRLTMAFISSVGANWLPGILREFRSSFPCLNLITHEETSLGVAALVEEATAELGFLELPTNNLLFEVKEIWNESFYAVVPADHALANKKNIGLQQLDKDPSAAAQAFIEFVKKRPFPAPYETTAVRGADLAVSGMPRPEADQMDHAAPQGLLTPQKFLDRSALVFPNKIAVKFNDQTYTYAELSRRVNRLASALKKAGLESGDRVAVICSNIPPMVEAHYGVAVAGGRA